MTKYLHIVCDAGLANRLHAIVGAQDIAHVTGRELIIHWPVNRECGAPFKRLFKNPVDSHGQPRYTFATREHVLALLSTRTCVKVYNCGYHNLPTETDECYRVAADDQHEHVIIKSWYAPQMQSDVPQRVTLAQILSRVTQFQPVDEVMAMTPTHFLESCPVLIGMHVRYGDKTEVGTWDQDVVRRYAVSRVEDFEQALVQINTILPNCNVLVASHNPEVEKRLREPRQLAVSLNKTGARDSVLGMREAVVDLWSLSRCKFILGSYWSQYSQLAAELGDIPLVKVGTKGW